MIGLEFDFVKDPDKDGYKLVSRFTEMLDRERDRKVAPWSAFRDSSDVFDSFSPEVVNKLTEDYYGPDVEDTNDMLSRVSKEKPSEETIDGVPEREMVEL